MFHHAENEFNLVGRAPTVNWVQFHAETGGCNVEVAPRRPLALDTGGKAVIRRHYRFQVQGPNAAKILEKLNGGPIPDVKFFHMDAINIKGRKVRALRHGMAGAPGLEIWGPYEQMARRSATAIVEAGKEFGLVQVGARAYATNTLESGWIPSPLPAVYTGEKMKKYREWLPANGYEATGSLGGSFVSNNIEDYYVTPYELGYGIVRQVRPRLHRPRSAREEVQGAASQEGDVRVERRRRDEGCARRMFTPGAEHYKYIDLPLSNYASSSYDKVMKGGKIVGLSMFSGISYNEQSMLSLGIVDPDIKVGDELTLVWGEENGGSKKITVERHKQTEIRVTVGTVPYGQMARETYRPK